MAIFSAIGTAIAGALFAGSAIAGSIIAGGLALGTQLLVSYLTRPKKRTYSAIQGEKQYGVRVPVWAPFGRCKVKGHEIFYAKWGAGNKFNANVFALANGWCDGLEPEVYFYGQKYTLVPRTIIGNEVSHYGVDGFSNLISIRFYDGRPGQLADGKLVADTANLGKTWKTTSRCTGLTYVVVEREWNEEKFDKGEPEFEFILRGLREYDPRYDSTVAGGSGPQRLDDPSTWVYTENPAVHRLNYQLGLRGYRSNRTLIGEGKTLGQLDLSSYFAAMNVADTLRGDGKPTYRASLIVTGEDDHTEILKEFDDAMAGYGMNRRGLSGVIPGAPQIPVAAIGPADIDMGRAKQLQTRKSAFALYNHLSGQFTSPEANWTPQSLDPIFVNLDVAADGRVRQTSNDFLQVTDPDIAEYLLQIRYRQNRKGGSATVPVSRRLGLKVQEGNWVTYAGKTWLITSWRVDEEFQFTLQLAETGPDVYSEDGIEPGPIVIPPTAPQNPSLLSTVQNFNVEVGFIEGGGGQSIPALRFTWTPPSDPTITEVRFQYFIGTDPASPGDFYSDISDQPERGEHYTTKSVGPTAVYTARATIRTVPDRLKTWTPWVTTATETGTFDVYSEVDLESIRQAIGEALQFLGADSRELRDRLRKVALWAAEQDAGDVLARQEIRRSITATAQGIEARFEERVDLVITDLQSVAIRTTDLEITAQTLSDGQSLLAADISNVVASLGSYAQPGAIASAFNSLSAEISAQGDQITAVSNSLTMVETSVGNFSASGLLRAQALSTMSGAQATVGLSAAASAGGAATAAALILNALAGGLSEIGLIADRVFIASTPDGANRRRPFVIQNGALFADELNVNWGNLVNVTIQWGQIASLVTGNFVAQSANIGTAVITGGKIAANVITSSDNSSGSLPAQSGSTYRQVCSVTVSSDSGRPVKIYVRGTWSAAASQQDVLMEVRRGSAVIFDGASGGLSGTVLRDTLMDAAGAGTHTYSLWARALVNNINTSFAGSLIAECNRL